ncbi:hypothetical protein EYF80_022241 [Liparis tanakae]|uniref:Uncharacterized protein n=1 Tax=Liparis tanakae TaxID=230148 RepID=A0A4Z2HP28_9TELE|nr:hypothetical protein EYF80_022241 [Liparis tanakae]
MPVGFGSYLKDQLSRLLDPRRLVVIQDAAGAEDQNKNVLEEDEVLQKNVPPEVAVAELQLLNTANVSSENCAHDRKRKSHRRRGSRAPSDVAGKQREETCQEELDSPTEYRILGFGQPPQEIYTD